MLKNIKFIFVLLFPLFLDIPDPPAALHLSEKQDRSVRLSWRAGDSHNSPINGMKDSANMVCYF